MFQSHSYIDGNIHITATVIKSTSISLINTPDCVKSLLVKSVCMQLHNVKRWIQRSNQIMYIVFKGKKKKEKILTLIFEVRWVLLIAWKGWKNRITQGIGSGSLSVWVCVICGYSFSIFRTGKSSIERICALSASFWWFKTEFENSFEIMRSNRMCWVYRPCLETQSAHYNGF